jgi:hypothetical protein
MRTRHIEYMCGDCDGTVLFRRDSWPVELVSRDCIPNCIMSEADLCRAYENHAERAWERSESRKSGPDYAHIMAEARKLK